MMTAVPETRALNDLILSGAGAKRTSLWSLRNKGLKPEQIFFQGNSERCDLFDLQLEYLRNYVFRHGVLLHGQHHGSAG